MDKSAHRRSLPYAPIGVLPADMSKCRSALLTARAGAHTTLIGAPRSATRERRDLRHNGGYLRGQPLHFSNIWGGLFIILFRLLALGPLLAVIARAFQEGVRAAKSRTDEPAPPPADEPGTADIRA